MTRIGEPRRGQYSGWPHILFVGLVVAGAVFGVSGSNQARERAEHRQQERCAPIALTSTTADELVDAGWELVGSNAYPPGCEETR